MALDGKKSSIIEQNNLLEPCWIAGNRKQFIKQLSHYDFNAIDVVASCEQICKLQTRATNSHDHQDVAQLTLGLSYILNRQVSSLLDDTKNLLDKVTYNSFDLSCPAMDESQKHFLNSQKRKRTISQKTTTTLRVAKRQRMGDVQLLDEQNIDCFRHMLIESQQWSTDTSDLVIEQSETIDVHRHCIEEHLISFTHRQILTEVDQDILWNDGFGEMNGADLNEFLPIIHSRKRRRESIPTTLLSNKRRRLATDSVAENDIEVFPSVFPGIKIVDSVLPGTENEDSVWPPLPPAIFEPIQKSKSKKKHKIIRDEKIKLTRQKLLRDRLIFFKENQRRMNLKSIIVKPFISSKILLNSLRQSQLFSDRLKKEVHLTTEQKEQDSENTLRSILGEDYSDTIASAILATSPIVATSPMVSLPAPELSDFSPPPALEINNNNIDHVKNNYEEYEKMDQMSIMMHLLSIWRDNPDQKSIDANKFVKSFPNRLQAASAFGHLLALAKCGFIALTTQPGSVEVDGITLGATSNKIIGNFTIAEQIY